MHDIRDKEMYTASTVPGERLHKSEVFVFEGCVFEQCKEGAGCEEAAGKDHIGELFKNL